MRLKPAIFLTACLLGQAVFVHADFTVPPFNATVTDNAGMLSEVGKQQITATLEHLYHSGGSQYAVLTVADLGGEAIEQASIAVTDEWKLGDKKKDNGVLIMISKADHRIRIEVGQGLEGDLTDAFCSGVIRNTMVPLMREGRVDGAVISALFLLIGKSDPGAIPGLSQVDPPSRKSVGTTLPIGLIFFILVIVIKIFSSFMSTGRRGRGFGGGMWMGGGGFGGGGFGGGGFSGGGGGGFSGGGASGGW